MKTSTKSKIGFFLGIIALVGLLCGLACPGVSVAADKPKVINIGTFADPSTIKIGWSEGWFKEATGVETKWSTFDSGADVILALTSGDLDFASLGSTPTAIALARGTDILIVAIEMDLADNEALIVRKEINVPRDLIGKKIATPFSSTSHYALMQFFKATGIQPSQLELLDMGSMETAGAYQSGVIDGGWVWDPAYSAMIKAGGHVMMTNGIVGIMGYPTWNNMVVRRKFAEQYPEVVVCLAKAFLRTVDFYHKDPAKAAAIVAKRLGVEEAQAASVMRGFGFPKADEQVSERWLGAPGSASTVAKGLQATSEFLVQQKAIKQPLNLNQCIKALDSSFIAKAAK
jgi:taurine transport system substrate-binding protein